MKRSRSNAILIRLRPAGQGVFLADDVKAECAENAVRFCPTVELTNGDPDRQAQNLFRRVEAFFMEQDVELGAAREPGAVVTCLPVEDRDRVEQLVATHGASSEQGGGRCHEGDCPPFPMPTQAVGNAPTPSKA